MYQFTYRAYWRDQGATDWNLIESPSPITWTQETTPASEPTGVLGGQCNSVYTVNGTWEIQVRSANVAPTEAGYAPGTWTVSNTSTAPRGPIRGIFNTPQVSGLLVVQLGVTLSSGPSFMNVYPTGSSGTAHYWNGINRNATTRWVRNVVITQMTRRGGLPDNCGNSPDYNPGSAGECITTFSTGLIISRPECIEVTTNPPECECCSELLPKTNSILSRLG